VVPLDYLQPKVVGLTGLLLSTVCVCLVPPTQMMAAEP
jgi:hypothetical protein